MTSPTTVIVRSNAERKRRSLRAMSDADLHAWVQTAKHEIKLAQSLPEDERWLATLWESDIKDAEKELRRRNVAESYKSISPEVIQRIKESVSVIDLFLDYNIPISPRAGKWIGKCPWHEDDNPSLNVWENRYRCFGCGAYGDAISFVELMDGVGFCEAVRRLGQKCGIEVKIPTKSEKKDSDDEDSNTPKVELPRDEDFSLGNCAKWVNVQLCKKTGRATRCTVSDTLSHKLLDRDRLFLDTETDRPYLLADDNTAVPLVDRDARLVRIALSDAGFNPTEPSYSWFFEDLHYHAYRHGKKIRLPRWSFYRDGKLYVSCGATQYVTAETTGVLTLHKNGDEDVLFAGDACLPAWNHQVEPFDMMQLTAFHLPLEIPAETPNYIPDTQRFLLWAWVCALLAGVRPLPILSMLGGRGSGKSELARAVLRIFLGTDGDVTPLSSDERDFWAIAQGCLAIGLDNVDTIPVPWFPDALAVAASGGQRQSRQFYTNSDILRCPVRAGVIVTSRSATFARADVAERTLPLLATELSDDQRCTQNVLKDETIANRDGILVYLSQCAVNMLAWRSQVPRGLPARFLDFAEIVWAGCRSINHESWCIPMLRAWRAAQMLSVGDADPLLSAIVNHAPAHGIGRCTPGEFVAALTQNGADIPFLGGGKVIAHRLREIKFYLSLAGWELTEERVIPRTYFSLVHKDTEAV